MNRHAMRGLVVQTLYSIDVGDMSRDEAVAMIQTFACEMKDEAKELISDVVVLDKAFLIDNFYYHLVDGVLENLERIDELISKQLEGWSFNRLNKVDVAIMRLCVYELMQGKKDEAPILIDEAIELTKAFTDLGENKTPKFNNSLLDKINVHLNKS